MSKQLRFDSNDRKQVNFYYSRKEYKKFSDKYPNLTSMFLSRCLDLAINNKGFVESVLFNTFDNSSFSIGG